MSVQPFPLPIGSHSEAISPSILLYQLYHQTYLEEFIRPKNLKSQFIVEVIERLMMMMMIMMIPMMMMMMSHGVGRAGQ